MVGSAIVRKLRDQGHENLLMRASSEVDLRDQHSTKQLFEQERPDYVYMAAARVGGIHANNTYRADFIYDNLAIASNVIQCAHEFEVKKLLFLGSSCIYPKEAPQPLKEDYLLTGPLEPTNEPYAIAKIAGIKLCENFRRQYGSNFISAMPTNLYGPGDNYHLQNSHVLPALLRKIHEAKHNDHPTVEIWGSGKPLREFMHVDDLADALIFLMDHYNEEQFVNVGTGHEISIKGLAELICEVVEYNGELKFNTAKPDGTMRKLMDSSRINEMGWKPRISLKEGIRSTYHEYLQTLD